MILVRYLETNTPPRKSQASMIVLSYFQETQFTHWVTISLLHPHFVFLGEWFIWSHKSFRILHICGERKQRRCQEFSNRGDRIHINCIPWKGRKCIFHYRYVLDRLNVLSLERNEVRKDVMFDNGKARKNVCDRWDILRNDILFIMLWNNKKWLKIYHFIL